MDNIHYRREHTFIDKNILYITNKNIMNENISYIANIMMSQNILVHYL